MSGTSFEEARYRPILSGATVIPGSRGLSIFPGVDPDSARHVIGRYTSGKPTEYAVIWIGTNYSLIYWRGGKGSHGNHISGYVRLVPRSGYQERGYEVHDCSLDAPPSYKTEHPERAIWSHGRLTAEKIEALIDRAREKDLSYAADEAARRAKQDAEIAACAEKEAARVLGLEELARKRARARELADFLAGDACRFSREIAALVLELIPEEPKAGAT